MGPEYLYLLAFSGCAKGEFHVGSGRSSDGAVYIEARAGQGRITYSAWLLKKSRDVNVPAAIDPLHIQGDGPDCSVPSVGAGRLRSCSLGSFQLPASSGLSVSILRILNLLT